MKLKNTLIIAAAALCSLTLATAEPEAPTKESAKAGTEATTGTKWEYKLVRVTYRGGNDREIAALNKALNETGAEGWELVNTVKSDTNDQLLAIFKRAK